MQYQPSSLAPVREQSSFAHAYEGWLEARRRRDELAAALRAVQRSLRAAETTLLQVLREHPAGERELVSVGLRIRKMTSWSVSRDHRLVTVPLIRSLAPVLVRATVHPSFLSAYLCRHEGELQRTRPAAWLKLRPFLRKRTSESLVLSRRRPVSP